MNTLSEKTASFLERFLAYAGSLDEWLGSTTSEQLAPADQQRFTRSLHRFAEEWTKLEAQWRLNDDEPARKVIEDLLRRANDAVRRCQARIEATDRELRVQLDAIREDLGKLRGGRSTGTKFKSDVDNAGAFVDRRA